MRITFFSTVLYASLSVLSGMGAMAITQPLTFASVSPDVTIRLTTPVNTLVVSQTLDPLYAQVDGVGETESLDNHQLAPQWLLAIALLVGAIAVIIGVYHYNRNERWHRIEFLRKSVREFEQDPDIWRALKILDFEEYRDYEITYQGDRFIFQVNNELLCRALATHGERIEYKNAIQNLKQGASEQATSTQYQDDLRNYYIETTIRDWFNKMLNGLEHFGYFVESGMFTANEIRPWMIYWIRLIADREYKRPGASKFYDQLYTYIHEYGFSGVIQLFERFGYRILPTPYLETDFVNVKKGLKLFDLQTALSLAKAAYLIYEDTDYVKEISLMRWGIPKVEDFQYFDSRNYWDGRNRDTQAFMFKTSEFIVLAFRGSQEIKDWQTNFSTRLKKFSFASTMEPLEEDLTPPRGQVHRGFQAAWNSVEDEVIQQIRYWNKGTSSPLPLLITGHSLGGALATIAAASLVKRKFDIHGVYTFGQPRVGDWVFVAEISQLLRGKVFRFVNNNDIVPHIPPPYLPWNPLRLYMHLGQMLYFDAYGNLAMHPNRFIRLINFFIGIVRDAFEPGFDMINDHRMEYYISHLKKALDIEKAKMQMIDGDKSTRQ